MKDCPFCNIPERDIIHENGLALCFLDRYPVTEGHSLIIPKRHVSGHFQATPNEVSAIMELAELRKRSLLEEFSDITGFNIGTNCGRSAGQTVFHLHWHLIPRRDGDIEDPRGGVRGVIPVKRIYP